MIAQERKLPVMILKTLLLCLSGPFLHTAKINTSVLETRDSLGVPGNPS